MTTQQKVVTPAELAAELAVDPKRIRKFLRDEFPKDQQPGRGHRWELPGGKREINRLRKQYQHWEEAHSRTTTAA